MAASEKNYLNTYGAARKLKRSPAAVRNLCMRCRIPYRKAGGRLIFIEDELDQWIENSPGLHLEEIKDLE